jgi:hypothetical protein
MSTAASSVEWPMPREFTDAEVYKISHEFRNKTVLTLLITNIGKGVGTEKYTLDDYAALCENVPFAATMRAAQVTGNVLVDYLNIPDILGMISYNVFYKLNKIHGPIFPYILDLEMCKLENREKYQDFLKENGMEQHIIRYT